ncbi:MAG: hypothetical protein KDA91_12235, partial [Planctomycetaceae bacterium]|nr:hypothetical protein [Planctomycetaceae bacterium]
MIRSHLSRLLFALGALAGLAGCNNQTSPASDKAASSPAPWLGIPSAVNQIIAMMHDGTGWILNKSEVIVKKSGNVRSSESTSNEWMADFLISVHFGG